MPNGKVNYKHKDALFRLIFGEYRENAVRMAIDSCIEDGILEYILRKESAMVRNILISGLTEEEEKELHKWEIEHTRELALEEGREKEIVLMYKDGDITEETALRRLSCSKEDLSKYIEKYGK